MRDTLSRTLQRLATHDSRVVFVGSDLPYNDMAELRAAFPHRFLMEGIAEQYVLGMAAGLASGGLMPYVQAMPAFIVRRAFEQVFIDIGLQRLPVRIVASGCGLDLSALGPTHMALEDLALLRQVPNMGICIPRTGYELQQVLLSTAEWNGPLYIRLTYGGAHENDRGPIAEIGRACLLRHGKGELIVSTGVVSSAILAIEELLVQGGLNPGVLHFSTLRPFDSDCLCESARRAARIIVVEEHHRDGGLGSTVIETLADARILRPTTRIGTWFEPSLSYGDHREAAANFGLRGSALANAILAACVHPVEAGLG